MIFGERLGKDAYRRIVWGPGRRVLGKFPSTWEMKTMRATGRVMAGLLLSRRQQVKTNLRRAFPDRNDLDVIVDAAFATHFANQYACFTFGKCTIDNWTDYIRFDGIDNLQAAFSLGRGVVLMHPHMGPTQLPLHVLGCIGWPMHQIGGGEITRVELSQTGRWAAQQRTGHERVMPVTIHDGKRFIRPVVRALQSGAVMMTACDGTGGGTEIGRRVPRQVLSQPMLLPTGPIALALMTNAPLLTIHCYLNPDPGCMYVAEIGGPIEFERQQSKEVAIRTGLDASAEFLNRVLGVHPGDWLFWDGFAPGGLIIEETT